MKTIDLRTHRTPQTVGVEPVFPAIVLWSAAVLGALAFGLLAFALFGDGSGSTSALAAFDASLHRQLQPMHDGLLFVVMQTISTLHDPFCVLVYTLALCAYILWRGDLLWTATAACLLPASFGLNWLLKNFFERARPPQLAGAAGFHSFSFPSGHTLAATMLYGLLACFIVARTRSQRGRIVAMVVCAAAALLVAVSRVFIGAHYLSDVVASICEGIVCLSLGMLLLQVLRTRLA